MKNPRHIAIDGDVFRSMKAFAEKHGFKIKSFCEEAIILHISNMENKLTKVNKS